MSSSTWGLGGSRSSLTFDVESFVGQRAMAPGPKVYSLVTELPPTEAFSNPHVNIIEVMPHLVDEEQRRVCTTLSVGTILSNARLLELWTHVMAIEAKNDRRLHPQQYQRKKAKDLLAFLRLASKRTREYIQKVRPKDPEERREWGRQRYQKKKDPVRFTQMRKERHFKLKRKDPERIREYGRRKYHEIKAKDHVGFAQRLKEQQRARLPKKMAECPEKVRETHRQSYERENAKDPIGFLQRH